MVLFSFFLTIFYNNSILKIHTYPTSGGFPDIELNFELTQEETQIPSLQRLQNAASLKFVKCFCKKWKSEKNVGVAKPPKQLLRKKCGKYRILQDFCLPLVKLTC